MYTEHVKSISLDHLRRMMEGSERVTLLDVRSHNDYDKEHIKGARSLPLDEIEESANRVVAQDDNIIVYCDSFVCSASTSATKILSRIGFKNVRDFKGGIREWKLAGLPTVSSYT